MSERKKFLLLLVSIFVWVGSLLAWAGWWVSTKPNVTATESSHEQVVLHASDKDDHVVLPLYEEVSQSINPLHPDNDASKIMLNFIYEPLVEKQLDGSINGVLAHKWHVTDNGKKVTIQLRQGVYWHDGQPFTADDVVYTYRQLADPDYKGPYRAMVQPIEGVKDVREGKVATIKGIEVHENDPHKIVFHLGKPTNEPTDVLQVPIIPRQTPVNSDKLTVTELVGTGPYLVSARNEPETIELARFNRDRGGEQLHLENISLTSLTIDEAMQHFQEGKLTVLPQLDASFSADVRNETGLTPMQQSSGVFHYIAFNHLQKLWDEPELRRAVGQTLNKQRIVNNWLDDYGTKVDTPRGTQIEHAGEPIPKQAQRKLKQENLSLHYSSEWVDRDQLAEMLQTQWKEANIDVKPVKHESVEGLMDAIRSGEADMFLMSDWVRTQPDKLLDWWEEENLQQWTHWPGAKVQSSLDQAVSTEGKEREQLMREWDELFVAEAPIIPLVQPKVLYFVADDLHGVKANDFKVDRYDVENWRMADHAQLAQGNR